MRWIMAKSILVLILLITASSFAQQGDAEQDNTPDAAEQTAEQDAAKQSEPEEVVNPDASITPTEEISEDKPVAFPVDI